MNQQDRDDRNDELAERRGESGLTGTGSAGSSSGGVSGRSQERGTTEGAIPVADTVARSSDDDSSTLSGGLAQGTEGSFGRSVGERIADGETMPTTRSGMTRRDQEETGSAAEGHDGT